MENKTADKTKFKGNKGHGWHLSRDSKECTYKMKLLLNK